MNILFTNWVWIVLLLATTPVSLTQAQGNANELSMFEAIDMAKANDPWITGSQFKQAKLKAKAVAAGQLADPTISLGIASIGTDTFDFSQEPMTQLKVGVSQMFSRGQTRSLKTEQMNLLASEQPILRAHRLASITLQASHLWLDAYKAQESIRLIEQDRSLFEQLVDLVEASYSSGFGQTRQHDVLRAQLELTRLDDRLTQLRQNHETSSKQLKGFISQDYLNQPYKSSHTFNLNKSLPEIDLVSAEITNLNQTNNSNKLLDLLTIHPAVQSLDRQIMAEDKGVELAQQKYKPAWGINASYGYRDDTENKMNRADLFSIGVTFDLPLFTKNRQDQDVQAAVSSVAAKETEKTLLLRQLMSAFEEATVKLNRLQQRKLLYAESLLPQMNQQVEASLTAYTHDDGDFAEVIRAKIAELNAQIDSLEIEVNIAKTKVELNYLLAGNTTENTLTHNNMENHHE